SGKDKFLWEVGDQWYVDKILRGGGGEFDRMGQYKGLWGFGKRDESEDDVWERGDSCRCL
ncbi:1-deoxy-D-xylulose-5-phosphate synthase N-terminal domain-containing protein, partial [Priestia megaterium]|uniref:1-deoxy-D-xylulose-5-phosphate synthase N-terminal domain-containing protein n=1 Tax=Priestia megaterium TaxID=1404 RepID=UPI0012B8CB13